MRDLAILADDLTGALDTAAAFASRRKPVEASWRGFVGERSVVDTETRSLQPSLARQRVAALLPELRSSRTAFKKLDSLLRGNSFAELGACCRSGSFDAVYIAPAFPAQGRITVDGRQLAVQGGTGCQVAPSLIDALDEEGVVAKLVRAPHDLPSRGVAVCDASSDQDLQALVGRGRSGTSVLWCGSAGLARALAGPPEDSGVSCGAVLAILGSRHEVTRRHAFMLRDVLGHQVVDIDDAGDTDGAVASLAATLRQHRRAAMIFDLPPLSEAEAEHIYRQVFSRLRDSIAPPTGIIVVGGDTVFRLMDVLGASGMSVVGQRAPGIPVARIRGGAWADTVVVSKSGAFADAGLFAEFIHEERQSA